MTHVTEEQLVAYALDDADEPARGVSRDARRRLCRVPRVARANSGECSIAAAGLEVPERVLTTTAPRSGNGFAPQLSDLGRGSKPRTPHSQARSGGRGARGSRPRRSRSWPSAHS